MPNHHLSAPTDTAPAVVLSHVSKVYQQGTLDVPALNDVSLTIPAGRFVAIMGASGSGKSTLLHLIAGLTTPTSGTVTLFGTPISQMHDNDLTRFRRQSIGLIFQSYNLLPTMTALENVCLPQIIDGQSLRSVRERGEKLMQLVGLADRLDHHPDELSGGQQQRVAIARALIQDAKLLLADEPTGNLDSKTGEKVMRLLRALVNKAQRTVIMVTHDPKTAAYADEVITLNDGQILERIGALDPLDQVG